MRQSGLLVALTLVGSAVSWWPSLALHLPVWIPFGFVATCMCLSMALVPSSWPLLLLSSGIGTFGGLYFGSAKWPPDDPIAGGYVLYIATGMALLVMLVGIFAGLILRRRSISNIAWRRTSWVAILVCVAFGLLSLAFAPTLIQHRLDRNEQLAKERLTALKDAMERAAKAYKVSPIYGGMALKPHYFGPPFKDMNWKGVVKQDGYFFKIDGYGAKSGGYTISAVPVREHLDGTRRFRTDELGKIRCRVEWNGSRNRCLPCSREELH
jgi:MFS family permease